MCGVVRLVSHAVHHRDALTSKHARSMFEAELAADKADGIGFAFGGVEPGRLHAHGVPVESHKVFYSIAVCGK